MKRKIVALILALTFCLSLSYSICWNSAGERSDKRENKPNWNLRGVIC